jgi:hypothetical protein
MVLMKPTNKLDYEVLLPDDPKIANLVCISQLRPGALAQRSFVQSHVETHGNERDGLISRYKWFSKQAFDGWGGGCLASATQCASLRAPYQEPRRPGRVPGVRHRGSAES